MKPQISYDPDGPPITFHKQERSKLGTILRDPEFWWNMGCAVLLIVGIELMIGESLPELGAVLCGIAWLLKQ